MQWELMVTINGNHPFSKKLLIANKMTHNYEIVNIGIVANKYVQYFQICSSLS